MPPATVAVWKELYKFLSKYHLIGQERRELIQRYAVSMCVCVCERERESERATRAHSEHPYSTYTTVRACVLTGELCQNIDSLRTQNIEPKMLLILHILLCMCPHATTP